MSTYEKIFELGDKLAHQNPAEGCEEFYMDKVYKMRDIQSDARYLTETNPKDIEKKITRITYKSRKISKITHMKENNPIKESLFDFLFFV